MTQPFSQLPELNVEHILVRVAKMYDDVVLPQYESAQAAGFDIRAYLTEEAARSGKYSESFVVNENGIRLIIKPGERVLVTTGLKFQIPPAFELQIRPRSGLALKKGITVLNSPGTVDADYRGEVGIILINHGKEDFVIGHGERVAQGVLARVPQAEMWLVDESELNQTDRGDGGFGHSGVK